MAKALSERPTVSSTLRTAGTEPERKRINGTRWWAWTGVASVAMFVYLGIAWFTSGDAKRTPTGVDPVPWSTKAWAWGFQIGAPLILLGCIIYVIRRSRREGRLHFDGLLMIGATVAIWLDPATTNYFRTQMLYNSYMVNLGSWAPHTPGWLSPNAARFPEPLINWGALYAVTYLLSAVIGCACMRWAKRRWPTMGNVGLVLCGFLGIAIYDFVSECFFIRTQLYAYGGVIRGFSVWSGRRYQFPIYESIIFGACWTFTAALRYFRDDKGRSVVERGIDDMLISSRKKTGVRILAVTGFTSLVYVVYSLVFSLSALWGGSFPKGYPSYMINGMCGAGTKYECLPPRIPTRPGALRVITADKSQQPS
jgi:hypothetical protein